MSALEQAVARQHPGMRLVDIDGDAVWLAAPGELGEEGLDRVQPGARGRREVEDETRVAL